MKLLLACCAVLLAQAAGASEAPAWLYPINPPAPVNPPVFDRSRPLRVPGSPVTYTEAQLNDLFTAPDWFPRSHTPMPAVVARGRAPDLYACGFCHTPSGQGRPENASLAGLPANYIVHQLADMKSGARHGAAPGAYRPSERMFEVAQHATASEVAAAAEYFSRQPYRPHVRVVEQARVPRSQVIGWVYAAVPGGGDEPLGQRLMEFTPDPGRHERRDDGLVYTAYVPAGSLARGRLLARGGGDKAAPPCITCHGNQLQGTAVIPRLAGRSPTYLLRQLLAFKSGARAGTNGQLMRMVVANLQIGDMIDVAAYAASQQP